MSDRATLVLELIVNPKNIQAVLSELASYGWYCEKHLAQVTKINVLAVLKQFEAGTLTGEEVTAWANSVGGRTDIGFEFGDDGAVEESLFWLAHPNISGPVSGELCRKIVALYERRSRKRKST